MRKFFAELFGTYLLVLFGCGTAMLIGNIARVSGRYLLTAIAFGLAFVAAAYCVGRISGSHFNPAVSFGMLLAGKMHPLHFVSYLVAQFAGAFAGAETLNLIFALGGVTDQTGSFASNNLIGVNGSILAGLLVETILTFVFVLVFLRVSERGGNNTSLGRMIIGMTLSLVNIFGIRLTAASVNPARSFGTAFTALLAGNVEPIFPLWIFLLAPMGGGGLAAIAYRLTRFGKS